MSARPRKKRTKRRHDARYLTAEAEALWRLTGTLTCTRCGQEVRATGATTVRMAPHSRDPSFASWPCKSSGRTYRLGWKSVELSRGAP